MIMNYEKRYNELIDAIKEMMEANPHDEGLQNWVHDNVPELTESEDEKMIKFIKNQLFNIKKTITENYELDAKLTKAIAWLEKLKVFAEHGDGLYYFGNNGFTYVGNPTCDNVSWIEKQGEKPQGKTALEAANKEKVDNRNCATVEPKFNVGDWIVWQDKTYKVNYNGCGYELVDQNGFSTSLEYGTIDESAHLWTIADAKPGDVLACKGNIEGSNGITYERICLFNNLDSAFFTLTKTSNCVEEYAADVNINYPDNTVPATKEQKEILFMTMKESGYKWDVEKKELKKIEPKSDAWTEKDKIILEGIIDEIEANKNSAPSYDLPTYDKFLNWLESLKKKIKND